MKKSNETKKNEFNWKNNTVNAKVQPNHNPANVLASMIKKNRSKKSLENTNNSRNG